MSHIKCVSPSGWDFGSRLSQVVKVSSRGLVGNDRREFLKFASYDFVQLFDNIKVAKDEEPVHQIALGASEIWNTNRNGDAFSGDMLRRCGGTFEKFAKSYRNHKNKDPSKSYGYVKKAAYNEKMHRTELLTMLNKTAEAADRNGGLVADLEIEKLAKGEDLPVSMAIRVPYDVCKNCGNKARTRDEYCTEKSCISDRGEKRAGCKDGLTTLYSDGHIQSVDNPDGTFFDISSVFRPADRTAYGSRADYLTKSASFGAGEGFMPGSQLAEELGVTAPLSVILDGVSRSSDTTDHQKGLMKLAAAMSFIESSGGAFNKSLMGCADPVSDNFLGLIGKPGTDKSASSLSALADRRVILNFEDYARWEGNSGSGLVSIVKQASGVLPNLYTWILHTGRLERGTLGGSACGGLMKFASSPLSPGMRSEIASRKMQETYSVDPETIEAKLRRGSIRGLHGAYGGDHTEKKSFDLPSVTDSASEVICRYGMYKLACLYRISGSTDLPRDSFKDTVRMALSQNRS